MTKNFYGTIKFFRINEQALAALLVLSISQRGVVNNINFDA